LAGTTGRSLFTLDSREVKYVEEAPRFGRRL
jgi:hypothetical protein